MSDQTRLPNAVVIGAPRSGTTSLFFYLRQHPDVYLPTEKELHYFTYDLLAANANGPGDKGVLTNLCATREDYCARYAGAGQQKCRMEISPSYLYYSEVGERIRKELGDVKIIVLLRAPLEKAYSQYMHMVRLDLEPLGFYDALMAEKERIQRGWSDIWRYVESSLYTDRLRHYMAVFGADNVKVMLLDDLVRDPDDTLRQLFRFLSIDDSIHIDTSKVYNRSGQPRSRLVARFFAYPNLAKSIVKRMIPERIRVPMRMAIMNMNSGEKTEMDPMARQYLARYFEADIEALEALISRRTGWLDQLGARSASSQPPASIFEQP